VVRGNFFASQDGTGREGGFMTTAPALDSACGPANDELRYFLALTTWGNGKPSGQARLFQGNFTFFCSSSRANKLGSDGWPGTGFRFIAMAVTTGIWRTS